VVTVAVVDVQLTKHRIIVGRPRRSEDFLAAHLGRRRSLHWEFEWVMRIAQREDAGPRESAMGSTVRTRVHAAWWLNRAV